MVYFTSRIITGLLVLLLFFITIGESIMGFNLGGFLMLLALDLVILFFTIIAWRKPKIGGIIFLMLGIFATTMMIVMPDQMDLMPILVFGLPIIVAGILFLIEGF